MSGVGSGGGGGAIITLKHIFGLKGDVANNIHYLDETHVMYPAGYNIPIYDLDKKTQRFLPLTSPSALDAVSSGDISAMAVCSLTSAAGAKSGSSSDIGRVKRKILAVAERGEAGKASVSMFDPASGKRLGKGGFITSPEIQSTEIVSMDISPDGKHLLTQGGAPDWTLINWQHEKSKPLQIAKVSNQSGAVIHQVSYCPADPSVVCVTGNGILRFLHIEQNEFKSIPFSMGKREPQNYLCHCWIDDRILVGTDSGDILVFENAEFRGVLESSPAGGKSIDCIAPYSKGFVIGMDEGYVMIFDRDSQEIYKYAKSFQIDQNFVKVTSLAISPSEDYCVCTLENNQAYVLGLSNTDILKSEEMNFEPLAMPFHHMQITGLDVCIRKPLLATCGMDRSVRIWNYNTRQVEVTRFFNEQPHSIAFHPSGLHILVGFTDNLRMLNILMDDCIPVRDFAIKGCKECQFSHGGQYFAAANGSVIQVFATYTCEMLGSFNVHKAKVRSIAWLADDSSILSAGMDGQVFTTKIKSGEHVAVAKHKCNYTCAVGTSDGRVYAVGSDRHLKVIQESTLQAELNCGVVLTQLCTQVPRPPLKDRFLFAGTDTGVIRVFPIPVEGKCYDQQVHTGAITRMRCSPDDNYLFTVGEDGCLTISQIEQKRDASSTRARLGHAGGDHTLQWAEEILVNRSDLEEKMSILSDLQSKVTELMLHNETTLSLKDLAYKEKLRETTDKFNLELESDKHRYQSLEEEKEQLEKSYALKVEQLNSMQKSKMSELDAHHQFKLQQEQERFVEMKQRGAAQRAQCEDEISKQDEQCLVDRNRLSDEYEAKIQEARQLKLNIMIERESKRQEMQEDTSLTEAAADEEIDQLKMEADKKLTAERLTKLCLKDENAIFKRKFASLREDITENLDDLSRMKDKQQSLYDTIDTLEKDIKGHVKEIKERESTIEDKRHRIFELRKKNQELEKFKFVLDYKITELKRQIQPRKQEMKELNEQITEMEKELKNYKKESADLQLDVTELNLKYNGMETNITKEVAHREEVAARLAHFKTELHEVFQDIEDAKKLKDGIKRLFQRHVQNAQASEAKREKADAKEAAAAAAAATAGGPGQLFKPPAAVDDVHNDYQRQRHYLERSIDSHNAKCKKDMRVHIKEHTRIMQENIALTKEVNELRREKYHILVQQKSKEAAAVTKRPPATNGASGGGRAARLSKTISEGMNAAAAALVDDGDETEVQQEQIRALKKQLALLESEYQDLVHGGTAKAPGALSARGLQAGEKLPQIPNRTNSAGGDDGTGDVTSAMQSWRLDQQRADDEADEEKSER